MQPPTETALIVPIPEAEDAVGSLRATLDRSASWGVPAHVTVLYPFLPPDDVNSDVLAALNDIISATPRFDIALAHTDWFDDTAVWLAPLPDWPFRDLTSAVWRRFPDTPPYSELVEQRVGRVGSGIDHRCVMGRRVLVT
jgi:2'-5' RNA ligase